MRLVLTVIPLIRAIWRRWIAFVVSSGFAASGSHHHPQHPYGLKAGVSKANHLNSQQTTTTINKKLFKISPDGPVFETTTTTAVPSFCFFSTYFSDFWQSAKLRRKRENKETRSFYFSTLHECMCAVLWPVGSNQTISANFLARKKKRAVVLTEKERERKREKSK